MSHTYTHVRGGALITLVALVTQIFSPILPTTYALNNTFYVSASGGNDANDGLSPATPWQTVSYLNTQVFGEGDLILFQCGDSWSEEIVLDDSGVIGNPFIISSYGTCDGSNNPLINGSGGYALSDSGALAYVTISGLTFSGATSTFDDVGTDLIIQDSRFTGAGFQCLSQSNSTTLTLSGNTFDSCQILLGSGSTVATTTIVGNTFTSSVDVTPIFNVSYQTGSSLYVGQNTFSNMSGGALVFSTNTIVIQNTFTNMCSAGTDCAVVGNLGVDTGFSTVEQNTFSNIGTGILTSASADAIRIQDNNSILFLTGNTISNAQRSLVLIDAHDVTVSGNTFFNPRTQAIVVEETMADATFNNTISNNKFLTYNPDYTMVKVSDTVDASGSLASLSNNNYLNIYKGKLPVIEVFKVGGNSYSVDKDNLAVVDVGSTKFPYFGYKNYTSTGSYSGSNLVTNGTFTSDITGWIGTNTTLSHDATGATLHASQGVTQTGSIASNSFSIVSGATYEISGTFRNLTNTGGSHIQAYLRQDTMPETLYADRVVDIVSTASGKVFSAYVTANTTAADARLDLVVSNPSTDIEIDNVVVRRVTGLTRNPRTNEARLIVNTGSTASSFACPGGGGCSSQYRSITNTAISFPLAIGAYSSDIALWSVPGSPTPTNILYPPTGTLSPSDGSVGNNETVDIIWTAVNSNTNILAGSILSGTSSLAFSSYVANTGTLTLTPPSDGINTYILTLENDIGKTTLTADVVTSNSLPITVPAFATGSEDTLSITGIVTATDINSGGSLEYSIVDLPNPAHGTITTFDADGTFDFAPTANFCGSTTFSFLATDGYGLPSDITTPGIVTVTVACGNDLPVAIDDSFTSTGGSSNILDVLTNDTDIDTIYEPQIFSLSGFTLPTHGSLTISGSYFDYVPDALYVGPDSFLYTMVDQSGGLSSTGTVTLNVIPGSNLAPFVGSASHGVTEDSFVTATLSGYDLNPGDVLTFTTATLPAHGVISITGSGFTYTPNADYNGPDSFTFTADDTALTSSAATITLTVTGTPDIPVVLDDTIGVEMSAVVQLDVMANDVDADSPYAPQNLSISGYTLPSHGTLSIVGTGFSYTSDTPYLGSDSFTYSIQDANGNLSNTGTVTLNITSTNTPPVAFSGAFSINEDTPLANNLSGFDLDGTPLTFLLTTSGSNGILSITSTGSFSYTPNANFYGTDSFSFQVTDGVFTSASETINLTINPINDTPIAGHDSGTGTEDIVLTLTGLLLNDTDVDVGDTLSLATILTQGTAGIATLSGSSTVVYTPIANACGMDTFTYQTQDQSGALSGTGNVTVNLICTNDAPTASGASFTLTGNVLTNSGFILTGGLAGSDIDLDPLTYTLGTTTTNGILSFNTGGTFSYSPNLGFSGSDSFTFSATDGFITTGTATILITVTTNNYNTVPVSYSGSFSVGEDGVLGGTLSGFDLEGTALMFAVGSGVTHGTLVIASTGGFTYTPTANYNGPDSFTFNVSDGMFASTYSTITLTVTSVNDLPIANIDTATGTEDTVILIPVLANDTDIDGTITSITGLTQPSTGGIASISGTEILFTPSANFCSATPVGFTYQAMDSSGGTSSSIGVSLTITCVADAPITVADAVSNFEDTVFTIPVLANDTDPDVGDVLSISSLTQPSTGGTVSISGTTVQFSPALNFCSGSPVTFTYRARDIASNLSNTGTVSVTLVCVNDTPTVQSPSYTMTGNVLSGSLYTLTGTLSGADIEGSSLTFALAVAASSGAAVISSTGVFSYVPASGFVGTATFNYTVNDGSISSAQGIVSVCVISPNSAVARPSCAPPIAPGGSSGSGASTVITGNGGGGGSSGGGSSASLMTYSIVSSDNTSPALLRQLMLGRQYRASPLNALETQVVDMTVPFTALFDTIKTIVEYSRDLGVSSGDNALDIRLTGRHILNRIKDSDSLSQSEKADALRAAAAELRDQLNPKPLAREYKALKYVIRILNAKETLFRQALDSVTSFLESAPEREVTDTQVSENLVQTGSVQL